MIINQRRRCSEIEDEVITKAKSSSENACVKMYVTEKYREETKEQVTFLGMKQKTEIREA